MRALLDEVGRHRHQTEERDEDGDGGEDHHDLRQAYLRVERLAQRPVHQVALALQARDARVRLVDSPLRGEGVALRLDEERLRLLVIADEAEHDGRQRRRDVPPRVDIADDAGDGDRVLAFQDERRGILRQVHLAQRLLADEPTLRRQMVVAQDFQP